MIADPAEATTFYAYDRATGTLLASADGAATFSARGTGLSRQEPLDENKPRWRPPAGLLYAAPDPAGELWLAARASGLFRSTDGGVSFVHLAGATEAYSLGFGAPAPGNTRPTLYLAGKIGPTKGLFRSTDSGSTWLRINDDAHQFGALGHVTGDPL